MKKYDDQSKIDIFITDFSSMLYYFLYTGSEIILVNLDRDEFKLGNHIFDKFDTDFAFAHKAENYRDIEKIIKNIRVKNDGKFFRHNLRFADGIYDYLREGEDNV